MEEDIAHIVQKETKRRVLMVDEEINLLQENLKSKEGGDREVRLIHDILGMFSHGRNYYPKEDRKRQYIKLLKCNNMLPKDIRISPWSIKIMWDGELEQVFKEYLRNINRVTK